ncbi:hypothetical protein CPC08DRAFT_704041 [Agrocybe pediades]|nr:hypothetical protein CPC08DRAFT_704041 [Agrocybe pediades]
MILIEENSKSPFASTFENLRHSMNSAKRARSPEGNEDPANRPSKRPSLATGSVARFSGYRYRSGDSSRQTSEDWVQQAQVLSIDSPIYAASDHSHPYTPQDELEDVDMAMESEEPTSSTNENSTETQGHHEIYAYEHHLQRLSMTSHELHYGEIHQQPLNIPPHINVIPSTPVTGTQPMNHNHMANSPSLLYSTANPSTPPPESAMPMSISPNSSFRATSPRPKRRVVFGPRANCEKCRLGERHFSHFVYDDHED